MRILAVSIFSSESCRRIELKFGDSVGSYLKIKFEFFQNFSRSTCRVIEFWVTRFELIWIKFALTALPWFKFCWMRSMNDQWRTEDDVEQFDVFCWVVGLQRLTATDGHFCCFASRRRLFCSSATTHDPADDDDEQMMSRLEPPPWERRTLGRAKWQLFDESTRIVCTCLCKWAAIFIHWLSIEFWQLSRVCR